MDEGRCRADVDNRSATPASHRLDPVPHSVDRTEKIDLHRFGPVLNLGAEGRRRIVDKDVNAATSLLDGREECLDIGLDTHVSRDEYRVSVFRLDSANRLEAPLLVDIGDNDGGAITREPP